MSKPHAHHIVYKGEFARSPKMQAALALGRSRSVLEKYDIDPVTDVSALMWAENKGHSVANAELVADKLEASHKKINSKGLSTLEAAKEMRSALQKIGVEVFGS